MAFVSIIKIRREPALAKQTTVALIGGLGFVGQRLDALLRASGSWAVSALDIVEASRTCDVTDAASLMSHLGGSDWVVNLAAVHHDNVRPISKYYAVNVEGARNVCRACSALGIHQQVFVSSVAVYGDTHGIPATEQTPHSPFNDYGKSKSQAEDVYRAWWSENPDRTLIILRPTVIFGERNRGNLFNLMQSIATGKFRMVGDGNVTKAIAYVENVASFIQFVMQKFTSGMHVFNYADAPDPTTAEIVSVIREELGLSRQSLRRLPYAVAYSGGIVCDLISRFTPLSLPVSAQRVKKFCTPTPIDASRAEQAGFKPTLPVMEALRQTVRAEFPR